MKKAFATAVLTAAALVAAAPAHAQVPPTPGVAFVNQGDHRDEFTNQTFSNAAYIGGPVPGNNLNVRVSGHTTPGGGFVKVVTFEEPTTLMIPGPIASTPLLFELLDVILQTIFPGPIGRTGGSQDCDYGLGSATCRVPGTCTVKVTTRLRDTIVLRQDASAVSSIGGPCRVVINGYRGNDTIDSRDGASTTVLCDGGFDRVFADSGDSVASDCEVVTRV